MKIFLVRLNYRFLFSFPLSDFICSLYMTTQACIISIIKHHYAYSLIKMLHVKC